MMVLAVLFTTLMAQAADNSGDGVKPTPFITDVMLIGTKEKTDRDALVSKYQNEGWTYIEQDLNAGAGGDFIHLLYKSSENTDGFNHGYITDFYISNTKEYKDEVTYQDRTYKLVPYKGSEHFVDIKGDLNSHAYGDFIHLYYTTAPMNDEAVSSVSFDYDQSNAVGNEGGSDGFDLNNGCENATKKIYMHITKDKALTPPSVNYISYTYDDVNGLKPSEMTCNDYKFVTSDDESWSSGWYVVSGNVEISNRIKVSGTVNLILLDDCMLTAKNAIEVLKGNTLNIFAQSEGDKAGTVKAGVKDNDRSAAIGGNINVAGGSITIYGGVVVANSEYGAAGIGGSYKGSGTVTIYSGSVEAHGGQYGAGIGGGSGSAGGTVTIYGGSVKAYGGEKSAGIAS